jgi:hypothetical protein
LVAAELFYKKYGSLAVAGGLFFPIIRTFAPVVAGMIHMNIRRFMWFISIVLYFGSAVLWCRLGGRTLPFLTPYLPYIVAGINPLNNNAGSYQDHQKFETGREVIAFELAARIKNKMELMPKDR